MAFPTTQGCVPALPSMLAMQALWMCCFYFLKFPLLERSKSGLLFANLCSNAMSSEAFPNHSPNKGAAPNPSISHHPLSTLFSITFSGMWCIMFLLILFISHLSLSLSLQLELRLICSFVLLQLLCLQVYID